MGFPILSVLILLPLVDILLAVVRRTRRGERPWHPDKQHLHHRMLQIGHGHRRAVLLLWLWAAVTSLGSVSFVLVPDPLVAGIGVVGLLALLWCGRRAVAPLLLAAGLFLAVLAPWSIAASATFHARVITTTSVSATSG